MEVGWKVDGMQSLIEGKDRARREGAKEHIVMFGIPIAMWQKEGCVMCMFTNSAQRDR